MFVAPALGAGAFIALLPPEDGLELLFGAATPVALTLAAQAFRLVVEGASQSRKTFWIHGGIARRRGRATGELHVTAVRESVVYTRTGPASGYCVYALQLDLDDGTSFTNTYLDRATLDRDRSALVERATYRAAAFRRESAPPDALAAPPPSRFAPITLPLLLIAPFAVAAQLLANEDFRNLSSVKLGVGYLQLTAHIERDLTTPRDKNCPTLDGLLAKQRIVAEETIDPWGTRYEIRCFGDDVHVRSAGEDRLFGTDDDVIATPWTR